MAIILQQIIKGYTYLNEDIADPRTKDLFLVDTLWRVPLLTLFYLYFAFVLGPKFMEKRQPYNLDRIIQTFNVLQVFLNLYILYLAIDRVWLKGYNLKCSPVDFSYTPNAIEISRSVWYYFLLKIMDWLDTVFFILRKKQSHVSFLHVYHHGGMTLLIWCCTKYYPGGHGIFLGTINALVHSIMYTYYLLSSMKVNIRSWKKYVTQLQMIQFFMVACHFAQLLWIDCGYPQWIAFVIIPQNAFMLVLFGEFYYNAYVKSASKTASTKMENNSMSAQIVSNGKLKVQ